MFQNICFQRNRLRLGRAKHICLELAVELYWTFLKCVTQWTFVIINCTEATWSHLSWNWWFRPALFLQNENHFARKCWQALILDLAAQADMSLWNAAFHSAGTCLQVVTFIGLGDSGPHVFARWIASCKDLFAGVDPWTAGSGQHFLRNETFMMHFCKETLAGLYPWLNCPRQWSRFPKRAAHVSMHGFHHCVRSYVIGCFKAHVSLHFSKHLCDRGQLRPRHLDTCLVSWWCCPGELASVANVMDMFSNPCVMM